MYDLVRTNQGETLCRFLVFNRLEANKYSLKYGFYE